MLDQHLDHPDHQVTWKQLEQKLSQDSELQRRFSTNPVAVLAEYGIDQDSLDMAATKIAELQTERFTTGSLNK